MKTVRHSQLLSLLKVTCRTFLKILQGNTWTLIDDIKQPNEW